MCKHFSINSDKIHLNSGKSSLKQLQNVYFGVFLLLPISVYVRKYDVKNSGKWHTWSKKFMNSKFLPRGH